MNDKPAKDKPAKDKPTRRSRQVATTLLTAAALAAISGCSHTVTTARCIGPDVRVLPDGTCGNGGGGFVGGGNGGYYRGPNAIGRQPQWGYGGSGGASVGSRATGYSTTAPSAGDISTHSGTVLRGGFGGEGGAHGGSEGEGGRHGGGGGE